MKNKSGRRAFLKNIGAGGTAAAFFPTGILTPQAPTNKSTENKTAHTGDSDKSGRAYNTAYTGANLNRVAFPIGGIGAGMFCLEGTGAISHMSIRHKPDIFNEPGVFAAISVKGMANGTKLLEGPVPDWKKFGLRDSGLGLGGSTIGLPHFREASFTTKFPFAHIDLRDADLPLNVKLNGWSPFIPGEEDSSGAPAGAIEYVFTNTGKTTIEAVFSFNAKNFLRIDGGTNSIRPIKNGFVLHDDGTKDKPYPADFAIYTGNENTVVDHCWFRGGWWDPFTMAWNNVKAGTPIAVAPVEKDAPGASLFVPFSLEAGKEQTIRLHFAWYVPDTDLTFGTPGVKKEDCDPANGCCNSPSDIGLDKYDKNFDGKFYKPWYSSRFSSVNDVAAYWKQQYDDLKKKTLLFTNAFYNSTLPPEVIEAVAANLTILKTPTVMRQYDGRLWNFEGCGDWWGSCHGSCTHVWNYAQATAHLFPALERSLRATEFCESQNKEGHQNFRSVLPIQPYG